MHKMSYINGSRIAVVLLIIMALAYAFSCRRPAPDMPRQTPAVTHAVPSGKPTFAPPPETGLEGNTVPRLVVGIVVDQMAYDFLMRYRNKYGDDGFERLLDDGYSFGNAKFNYVPTTTGPGHASIYTGAPPSVHGIIGNDWFVRAPVNGETYCVHDESVRLVGEGGGDDDRSGQMSPVNMLASTVTDELKLSTGMQSKVVGIALKDRAAILPAGHIADAAYWLDDESGEWVTSTYYYRGAGLKDGKKPELPDWVREFNKKHSAEHYLNAPEIDGEWNTLKKISDYTESLPDDNAYEKSIRGKDEKTGEYRKPVFPYVFKDVLAGNAEETKGQYGRLIKATPYGDTLTKDFAEAAIMGAGLGKDEVPDFLAISFSSTDVIGHYHGPRSVEVEDAYLRLDLDIADLLRTLDREVGVDNYIVFLTADHGVADVPLYLQDNGIPAGYFMDDDELISRLNEHLGKVFNHGGSKFVLAYNNQQVYLDRDLVNNLGLSMDKVEEAAAGYLMTLDGVADTVTATQLNNADFTSGPRRLVQNGYNRKRSGDVAVIMEPGWIEYKEKYGKKGTTHGSPYNYDTHVPLIFYGWNIRHGQSMRPVSITDIAPTLSAILRIPYPDGATGNPLTELFGRSPGP